MIPLGYSRSVLSGKLQGGEIWACGFWANEAPSTDAATQTQADDFGSDLASIWTQEGSISNLNNANMTLDKLSVYSYLTDSGKASFVAEHSFSLTGNTSGVPSLPDQCCLVATLNTGKAGRRNRGRVYWPITAANLTAGQLDMGVASETAVWTADLLGLWNAHLGDQRMVVLSQVAGSSNPITEIAIDTRIDIQRRRANKQTITGRATASI